MDVDEGVVLGLDRFLDKPQSGLFGGSAAFFDVALGAGTDNIFPNGLAAHTPGDNVVER